jgi:hypothetical protein
MISTTARLVLALALGAASYTAEAVDTFTIRHVSGPCSDKPFATLHLPWATRSRIAVALGERISVRLHSHGADLASGLTRPAGVTASIVNRGTTTDYPNAPIRFGALVAKGYLTVEITVTVLADRDVVVRWPTGTETIRVRGVADCAALVGTPYRTGLLTGRVQAPVRAASGGAQPNLLPQLVSTAPLLRRINVSGPIQVASTFCTGVPLTKPTAVAVPPLVWGVSSVQHPASGVRVELRNRQTGAVLSSFVSGPLQANGAAETRVNYPGRPAQVQVINYVPSKADGFPEFGGVAGCYISGPAASQTLDPPLGQLQIVVDPANAIAEGSNGEADNELAF